MKQTSPLLNLPLDILQDIFDIFQWPEKVTFSQTCKDAWRLYRQKCILIFYEAAALQRLEYLVLLTNVLPYHYLCERCCALHLLGPTDLPITVCDKHGFNLYPILCSSPEPLWSRIRLHPYYAVAFRHVHLATKHLRIAYVPQAYQTSIMQKFVAANPRFSSIGLDFIAEPIIVSGRFILKTTFEFYEGSKQVSLSTLMSSNIYFCPHHSIRKFSKSDDPLVMSIRSVLDRPNKSSDFCEGVYSCIRCPTDFSILIKDERVVITLWHDLGTGVTPEDPYWRSHTWDYNDNVTRGTDFLYEHGSIKRLYRSSWI